MQKRPAVGVAVIIVKNGKILLGKRLSSHGSGDWAFPGGHLELNESIVECAKREVFEETGLHIKNTQHFAYTNDIFKEEKKHYVTLFVRSEYDRGTLELKEPDRCSKWAWFEWEMLPEPLFLSLKNFLNLGLNPVNP